MQRQTILETQKQPFPRYSCWCVFGKAILQQRLKFVSFRYYYGRPACLK